MKTRTTAARCRRGAAPRRSRDLEAAERHARHTLAGGGDQDARRGGRDSADRRRRRPRPRSRERPGAGARLRCRRGRGGGGQERPRVRHVRASCVSPRSRAPANSAADGPASPHAATNGNEREKTDASESNPVLNADAERVVSGRCAPHASRTCLYARMNYTNRSRSSNLAARARPLSDDPVSRCGAVGGPEQAGEERFLFVEVREGKRQRLPRSAPSTRKWNHVRWWVSCGVPWLSGRVHRWKDVSVTRSTRARLPPSKSALNSLAPNRHLASASPGASHETGARPSAQGHHRRAGFSGPEEPAWFSLDALGDAPRSPPTNDPDASG